MNHTIEFALLEPVGLIHHVNVPARVRAVLKASWEPLTVSDIMERGNLSREDVLEGLDWLGVAVERVGRDKGRTIGVRALRRTPFTVHHDRAATGGSVATFRDVGKDRGIPERVFSTRTVGAPSSYSPTVATAYIREREAGKSHLESARIAGRAGSTIREWMKVHPEFRERVEAVRLTSTTR